MELRAASDGTGLSTWKPRNDGRSQLFAMRQPLRTYYTCELLGFVLFNTNNHCL